MTEDSSIDDSRIKAMINHAEWQSRIYKQTHNYQADWLVRGGIGSSEWIVSFPGSAELHCMSFERLMADGTKLNDEVNIRILQTVQKWLYHCRMGTITGKPMARTRWINYFNFAMNLTARANLYQGIYKTREYGFKLFDKDACKSIAEDLSQGGWPAALLLKERFISHLIDVLPVSFSLEDLLLEQDFLPVDLTSAAIAYFTKKDLYVVSAQTSTYETGTLSRDYIGSILGRPSKSLNNANFRLFIRQFEPTLIHEHLLQKSVRKNVHHSQNTKTIEEVSKGEPCVKSFKDNMIILKTFFQGHDALPEDIPQIDLNVDELVHEYSQRLKPGGHTNLLPLEIGFKCLNQASKWIVVYGQAIVDSLIFYTEHFVKLDENYPLPRQSKKKNLFFQDTKHLWITKGMPNLPPQPLTQALNIGKLQTKVKKNFPVDQSNYKMVMESFFGACAVIIGMVKPIRNAELSTLQRNCLSTDTGNNGAFIRHMVGKTGALGINNTIERPIPYVAAHAIQLLQVLGNSLAAIYGDNSNYAKSLFYIPGRGFKCPSGKKTEWKVNRCIDKFCDFVKMPVDKLGRRWYVRVHEMRKFFLLLVHRHIGDSGKELLRYMAGHSNRDHIDDYIAYDPSDSEAIRYESECIDDKLIALENGLLAEDQNQGLIALYTKALKDFKVTSIATINNREFLKYLDKAIQQPEFDMTTYRVRLETFEDEIYAIDFAISLGDKKDANYNN
ncbi:hypothetical protein [Pseudomonas sp. AL03]|uniref:hypothetical protein n=1 Tax=Pseudomonas sp. AL03 TaxID=3042230 RepID=UPI00249B5BD3|nr:hypothetical protein [Pseudomonas sp. AL03]MDI3275779.1 hypothetical protein [Pseudomonas sp. AL03]